MTDNKNTQTPEPQDELGSELWELINSLTDDPQQEELTPTEEAASRRREETEQMDRAFRQLTGEKEPRSETTPSKAPFRQLLRDKRVLLLAVLCCLLVALLVTIGVVSLVGQQDPYDGRILSNVILGGIDVGGMTRSEATAALKQAVSFDRTDMVVVLPDRTLHFTPNATGAKLRVKEAVEAAYRYGRQGTEEERQAAYQSSRTTPHLMGLLPYLDMNREVLQQQLEEYARSFATEYSPAGYRLEGPAPALDQEHFDPDAPCQTLLITLGTTGLGVDVEKLYQDILDAYSFHRFLVEASIPEAAELPTRPDVDEIYEALYQAPQDAAMNMQTFQPIPCVYGYGFDLELARQLVAAAADGETVSIPMAYIIPEVTGDTLLFQHVLGYCDTPHSSNEKRTANLELVCSILNGLVLNPGEQFSYNEVIGQRTKERGFQAAPAYSGTRLVDSIGGGVCQGSSTLYNACLLADMEILERISHGFPVNYLPKGLDATVNWGGPDFAFRNTSNYPIQLLAEVSDGYMRIKIMGTEERDYYVRMEAVITEIKEPTVTYEDHPADSGYTDGQVLQGGTTGYHVRSYKCKYDRETDELISREPEARSSYMMLPKIIVRIVDPAAPDPGIVEPPTPTEEGNE